MGKIYWRYEYTFYLLFFSFCHFTLEIWPPVKYGIITICLLFSPCWLLVDCTSVQFFRRFHAAYVDAVSNPFHVPGKKITSRTFAERVSTIVKSFGLSSAGWTSITGASMMLGWYLAQNFFYYSKLLRCSYSCGKCLGTFWSEFYVQYIIFKLNHHICLNMNLNFENISPYKLYSLAEWLLAFTKSLVWY